MTLNMEIQAARRTAAKLVQELEYARTVGSLVETKLIRDLKRLEKAVTQYSQDGNRCKLSMVIITIKAAL